MGEPVTVPRKPGLSPAELVQLAAFLDHVRRQWKLAAAPQARADLERRVRDAVTARASAVIRRATGRCETCGSPDKDQRIARLERELAEAARFRARVTALISGRRKTVRTDDLRTALGDPDAGVNHA